MLKTLCPCHIIPFTFVVSLTQFIVSFTNDSSLFPKVKKGFFLSKQERANKQFFFLSLGSKRVKNEILFGGIEKVKMKLMPKACSKHKCPIPVRK